MHAHLIEPRVGWGHRTPSGAIAGCCVLWVVGGGVCVEGVKGVGGGGGGGVDSGE